MPYTARRALWTLAAILLWEFVGQLDLIAGGALPGPSEIAAGMWRDRADYPPHVGATLWGAALGFVLGNAVGIAAGVAFALSPPLARLFRGVNVAVFALPPIAIAPILVITLEGYGPRIALAALGVYFVTMTATVVGIAQADRRAADLVRAYGGGRWRVLTTVELRGAAPMILSGLRVAAPNAVLGAILAEFGGGGRWGLGTYLLGSLGRADPARLWGIGLVATAIAAAGYLGFALLARRLLGSTLAVTLDPSPPEAPASASRPAALALAVGTMAMPFLLWWAFIEATGVPELIARTPLGVLDYLVLAETAPQARARLLSALTETLPVAGLGMLMGLLAAFGLAVSTRLAPRLVRGLMPMALFTQTMPLVALTPLLVLILGRGMSLTLWVTISVTFFPAFVTLAQGLALVPRAALELPRAYGAGAWREMRLVTLPAALPHLFAAARLGVPRAILGVMIAEWLATGRGLGNLLNQSRGYLDYGMIWSVAAVSVLIAALLYQVVVWAERRTLRRLGMRGVE